MIKPTQILSQFFKVMVSRQAYLNLGYLLASFPLSLFYFAFLVSGLLTGISLTIVWVGIPLLVVVAVGWWGLASLERTMAIHWLKEDLPAMKQPHLNHQDLWTQFKGYLSNPVTWKSPVYLLLKFPLGLATFVILVTLGSLTLAALTLPLTYQTMDVQFVGFFSPGSSGWQVDHFGEALLGTIAGLLLWPVTMQVSNGLTWLHAKFARLMLSVEPWPST